MLIKEPFKNDNFKNVCEVDLILSSPIQMKFSPIPVIPLPKLACSEMSCDIK